MAMPRRADLPEDFYELRNVPVSLPRLADDRADSCPVPMADILEYLKVEARGGEESGSEQVIAFHLEFLRTALADATRYWIWRFTDADGVECYVTAAVRASGDEVIGFDESFGLTPEQFIVADYYDLA